MCTRRLSRELLPGAPEKLASALETLELSNDRPHAALSDAEATADLYRELATRYDFPTANVGGLPVKSLLSPFSANFTAEPVLARPTVSNAQDSWLERLSGHVPDTGLREVDEYRSRLRAAMLDGNLSASETEQLIATAHSLGIGRDDALEIHGEYLRQLAVEAWADGVISEVERAYISDAAEQLGVSPREVDALLAEPVAGESNRIGLGPGDRVTFTGVLALGRDNWESRAQSAGLNVGGVTKSSALLVSANPDSMSGKARKAREYGVPIVDETTFARLLHEVEQDRDVADDVAVTDSDETGSSGAQTPPWYLDIFPWLAEHTHGAHTTDEVTDAWIDSRAGLPLIALSPRLNAAVLPEGAVPSGRLTERWLADHPEPLRASLNDLEDLAGFGPTKLRKAVAATVLAALDAPEPGTTARTGVYSADDLAAEPAVWEPGEISEPGGTRADAAVRTVAQWWALVEGRPPLPAGEPPAAVAAAVTDLQRDSFWADPADSVIVQARTDLSVVVGEDERDRDIFRDRLLGTATLDEIGQRHEVTRERIRQLEKQLKQRLSESAENDTGATITMAIAALPVRFGPLRQRAAILRDLPALGAEGPVPGKSMLQSLALLSTEWELTDRWLQPAGFDEALTAGLSELADDYGVVELAALADLFDVDGAELTERLREETSIALTVDGRHVFTKIRSYGDRAAAALSLAGEAATADEILEAIGGGNIRSLTNALNNDEQITRTGREQFALAEWGREEYTTLVEWIGKRVDEAGAVAVDELVAEATANLGVRENSVRYYASIVDFETEDGIVTRVEKIEEDWADPAESPDLYVTEDGWRLLTTVNFDHLRGSGFGVPRGVATILELPVLQKRLLDSPLGEQFVGNTRTGMSVGTIRRFLQELGSEEGDRVWVTFDRDGCFDVQPAAPRRDGLSGMSEVLNRMGLAPEETGAEYQGMELLNTALGLKANAPRRKTVSRFRHRRQEDLADLVAAL